MSSTTVIGIPTDDKAFERQCIPLFRSLINDPNVTYFGSRGKAQSGIDLLGLRDGDSGKPVGIQCKLKTKGDKLTKADVRKEVKLALAVKPWLTEYYVVTTASDEPELSLLAIELAQEQAATGRKVNIQVWGWETLQDKIRDDPRALAAFDPNYSASTNELLELGGETRDLAADINDRTIQMLECVEEINARIQIGPSDTGAGLLDVHLHVQVDQYRDLLNSGKPQTALSLFEKLEASFDRTTSNSIKARVKTNIAIARMRLGDDPTATDLLVEAFELDPENPKIRGNYVLALLLQGKTDEAWEFAKETLLEDPTNEGAAGLAFQAASVSSKALDPFEIVPAELLEELSVRLHRINYLREKGETGSWWELAAETLENFPDDANALRQAGDALLDEALLRSKIDQSHALNDELQDKLTAGAALLQRHWNDVRKYEQANEPSWIMVAHNLITAYRVIGDLELAQEVVDEMLKLDPSGLESLMVAAWVAIDRDDFPAAADLLRRAPESKLTKLPLMVALSNVGDWERLLEVDRGGLRETLGRRDQQLLDVLVFRARSITEAEFDLIEEADDFLLAWPDGVAAHIAVADTFKQKGHEGFAEKADAARALINEETSYSDRVMFAQLSLKRDAWDDIIEALEGYVSISHHSEPLAWLAMAYANAGPRPGASNFFRSLAPEIMEITHYTRMAGAAEYYRGDLRAAESYLRSALASNPSDLRALLMLASTLHRDNRRDEAEQLIRDTDENTLAGSPGDFMRLALHFRVAGKTERAMTLSYKIAATNRHDEEIVSSYPPLIFHDDLLPVKFGSKGPIGEDFWFDLQGMEGASDDSGVIERESHPGMTSYPLDHPLAKALIGKQIGDEVTLASDVGVERKYRVREIKHKCIWLLHDIMDKHATRFPEATSMFSLSMKEGDVQPVLDMTRKLQGKADLLATTYADYPVPVAAVAALSNMSVLAVAERLVSLGTPLRTCVGASEEREEAAEFVKQAKGKGVVLDTLAACQLQALGHLGLAKDYFGRVCVPRSTFDEMINLRSKVEGNRGREFMTLSFEGEQTIREEHTPEETEHQLEHINAIIADFEKHCEILPVSGSKDNHLEQVIGFEAAQKTFDPIHLAREEDLILVSEDLNLRQYAAQNGVKGGAWLQVLCQVLAEQGELPDSEYIRAVGVLAASLHGFIWLNAEMLVGLLTLEDDRAFQWYIAAIQYLGGPTAEMTSHMRVSTIFMLQVWQTRMPTWQKARAIGCLLDQLVKSRPDDWKTVLGAFNQQLATLEMRKTPGAREAREYFLRWMQGHFYSLEGIRQSSEPNPPPGSKPRLSNAQKSKSKSKGRRRRHSRRKR